MPLQTMAMSELRKCFSIMGLKSIARTQSSNKGTPLHRAAAKGHADVVKLLLERHADVEAWMPAGSHLCARR